MTGSANIPAALAQARNLQKAGKPREAYALYEKISAADPNVAEARYNMAGLALAGRNPKLALAHVQAALRLKPSEPAIWMLYARIVAASGDRGLAAEFNKVMKQAKLPGDIRLKLQEMTQAPKAGVVGAGNADPQQIQRAIGLLQRGELDAALKLAGELRRAHPKVAVIADVLATALVAKGDYDAALEHYRAAVELDPNYAVARNKYGRLLAERGQGDQGLAEIRRALEQAPDLPAGLLNLGVVHARRGEIGKAMKALTRASEVTPDNPEIWAELSVLETSQGDPFAGVTAAKRAIELGDGSAAIRIRLGRALAATGDEGAALSAFDDALAIAPDNASAHSARAQALQALGQFDDARAGFLRAIELQPARGDAYRLYGASQKLAQDDPLVARMKAMFGDESAPVMDRVHVGFALAKVMEDSGAHDRVFDYLKPANDLMAQAFPSDIDAIAAEFTRIKAAFASDGAMARDVAGTSDFDPILVTGLARSGTTLVEQIIASHPEVTGAGEVGQIAKAARELLADGTGGLRDSAGLPDTDIAALGQEAERYYRDRYAETGRITDKSLQSFTMIGMIKLALPRAKVIVVRRDPRDNLLSIYKNLFTEGTHRYAYDLTHLARYYQLYDDLIGFWRENMPGWFHEIDYEALIADPEAESRKLIAFCGLDWDDACLDFHQNKRRVGTLSAYQVRQPLYASSLKGWQRYEGELAELFEALDG